MALLSARMFSPVTIIDAVAAIENTTGRTSDAIQLASLGRDSFILELDITPNETTDALLWELRPLTFGAGTYSTIPLRRMEGGTAAGPTIIPLTGSIANVGTDGEVHQYQFSGVHADSLQLWVASSETNSTYTITAKYRTIKYG